MKSTGCHHTGTKEIDGKRVLDRLNTIDTELVPN
jgi:hypothetical protein